MKHKYLFLPCLVFLLLLFGCSGGVEQTTTVHPVRIAGAMRETMWQGKLSGSISLDTLTKSASWYGIGPLEYLQGEILLIDGEVYVSRVIDDIQMELNIAPSAKAPFFVYTQVDSWKSLDLPDHVVDGHSLETFLDKLGAQIEEPFAFQLKGKITDATIHIQNLPPDTKVSSPEEAHQGQVKYQVEEEGVVVLGFFSRKHKGVFTHHDSFIHMHLLTVDKKKMGHVDHISFDPTGMKLILPQHLPSEITP